MSQILEIENKYLVDASELLKGMSLPAKDSRHRSKFVKLLEQAIFELNNSEMELAKEYGNLDENGELAITENGSFTCKTPEARKQFETERTDLLNEKVVIEGGMFARNIDEIPRILNEYDGELSGKTAEVYDRLLDEFEKNTEEKGAE